MARDTADLLLTGGRPRGTRRRAFAGLPVQHHPPRPAPVPPAARGAALPEV